MDPSYTGLANAHVNCSRPCLRGAAIRPCIEWRAETDKPIQLPRGWWRSPGKTYHLHCKVGT
eukprot:1273250-Amphidinium_carterae.1